jgi:hypothetical protein
MHARCSWPPWPRRVACLPRLTRRRSTGLEATRARQHPCPASRSLPTSRSPSCGPEGPFPSKSSHPCPHPHPRQQRSTAFLHRVASRDLPDSVNLGVLEEHAWRNVGWSAPSLCNRNLVMMPNACAKIIFGATMQVTPSFHTHTPSGQLHLTGSWKRLAKCCRTSFASKWMPRECGETCTTPTTTLHRADPHVIAKNSKKT